MLGDNEDTLSTMRETEIFILKRNLRRIFKTYWDMFKQINIENFVNIGKEHAQSIQNVDLKDTISLVGNF